LKTLEGEIRNGRGFTCQTEIDFSNIMITQMYQINTESLKGHLDISLSGIDKIPSDDDAATSDFFPIESDRLGIFLENP
jgi:hypothetical protein